MFTLFKNRVETTFTMPQFFDLLILERDDFEMRIVFRFVPDDESTLLLICDLARDDQTACEQQHEDHEHTRDCERTDVDVRPDDVHQSLHAPVRRTYGCAVFSVAPSQTYTVDCFNVAPSRTYAPGSVSKYTVEVQPMVPLLFVDSQRM